MYGRNLNLELREPYGERPHGEYITAKNGQLKLLLGEIEFLCHLDKHGVNAVVYAGAASGFHIKYLSEMFPHFKFWLFDPRPFSPVLKSCPNVEAYQEFFDEKSLELDTADWAFICDVRTGSDEKSVAADMEMQRKWVLHYKPRFSMLKFRLPWSAGKTHYFKGKLRLQAYTGPTSSELRLWVTGPSASAETGPVTTSPEEKTDGEQNGNILSNSLELDKDWDNLAYQDAVFYFQRRVRTGFYECGFMDGCYDCWTFVKILEKYGKKPFALKKTVREFYEWFGFNIMVGAHAVDHGLTHVERLKIIEENSEKFETEKNLRMERREKFFQKRDIKNTEKKYGSARGEEAALRKLLVGKIKKCIIISPVAVQYMQKISDLYPTIQFTVYSTVMVPFACPNMQVIYTAAGNLEKDAETLVFKSRF
jgi:hypothetical protein